MAVMAATYITEICWTPDLDRGKLGLQVTLNTKPHHRLNLHLKLSIRGVALADDTYHLERSELRRDIALEPGGLTMSRDDMLWSPNFPNLIDAELTLLQNETPVDEVLSYAGLRRVGFQNGRFCLTVVLTTCDGCWNRVYGRIPYWLLPVTMPYGRRWSLPKNLASMERASTRK